MNKATTYIVGMKDRTTDSQSEFTGRHQPDIREIFLRDIVAGVMRMLVSNQSRPLLCEDSVDTLVQVSRVQQQRAETMHTASCDGLGHTSVSTSVLSWFF